MFLISPLVWVCVLLILALISKKSTRSKRLLKVALLVLFIFSNTFLVRKVFNAYEAKYPKEQQYDVGILLGGFSNINKLNQQIVFTSAGDRFLQTVALYKQGKIKKILITSGSSNLIHKEIKEADLVRNYLNKIGIPDSAILIENQSRNTIENAKFSKELINKINPQAKILVITSAWHIPRAKLIFSKFFEKDIQFYPTNHIGKTEYDLSDFIIPSSEALSNWNLLLKEWLGLVVDNFRS